MLELMRQRPDQQTFMKKGLHTVFGPVMRNVFSGSHSPTPYLAKFLTDVARGGVKSGLDLSDEGITGGGSIISNKALRRVMGL